MPSIGRYEPDQVKETPLATPSADPAAFGAAQGRTLEQAGGQVSQLSRMFEERAQELKDRSDRSAAKDAYVQLGDTLRGRETSYRELKKGDTRNLTERADKEVGEDIALFREKMENDEQRILFDSLAQARRTSLLDAVARYQAGELRTWEIESSTAMVGEAIQVAAENPYDPEVMIEALRQIDIAVNTAMPGSSAEAVRNEKEKQITMLHVAVIEARGVNDAKGAKEYYEQHKGEIDGVARAKLEEKLKKMNTRERALNAALDIYSNGKTIDEMTSASRKLDPEISKEVGSLVRQWYADKRLAEAVAEEQQVEEFWKEYLKDPDIALIPADLPAEQIKAAMLYIDKWNARADVAAEIETDWNIYYKLKNLPLDDFKELDLRLYRAHLANAEFKELVKLQYEEKHTGKPARVRTWYMMASDALEVAGYTKDDFKERDAFFREYEALLAEIDNPTTKDAQNIIDYLFVKGSNWEDRSFLKKDSNIYRFQKTANRSWRPKQPHPGAKWNKTKRAWSIPPHPDAKWDKAKEAWTMVIDGELKYFWGSP